ncbi:MAG: helix-turn-helix domain-containing protein [Armatimonadota bacterium]
MTAEELADYLRLDRQTIYRKFRRGELPGVRIGRAIRFKRDVVDSWLRVMSSEWGPEQRKALYARMERFARERGITEEAVTAAVRARRARQ